MKSLTYLSLAALAGAFAYGTDGTVNRQSQSTWSTASHWVGGIIGDGAGSTVTFSRNGLTGWADLGFNETSRTIGNLKFTGLGTVAVGMNIKGGTGSDLIFDNNGSASWVENDGWGAVGFAKNVYLANDLVIKAQPTGSDGKSASAAFGFNNGYEVGAQGEGLRTITTTKSDYTPTAANDHRVVFAGTISGNIAIRHNSGNTLNFQEAVKDSYYGGLYIRSGTVNSTNLGGQAFGTVNNVITFETRDSASDPLAVLAFTGTLTNSDQLSVKQRIVLQADGRISVGMTTGTYKDITLDGVVSGAGAMIKQGAGHLILNAQNTYTGKTSIQTGKLSITKAYGVQAVSGLVMGNNNATSLATLDISGYSQAFASFQLSGIAEILIGDQAGTTLTFGDSSAISWGADDYTLSIIGLGFEDGVSVRFGTDGNSLTEEQLAKITINGEKAYLWDNGYLATTIPEASSSALALLALALAMAIKRRR